jgi:hypothetical protein
VGKGAEQLRARTNEPSPESPPGRRQESDFPLLTTIPIWNRKHPRGFSRSADGNPVGAADNQDCNFSPDRLQFQAELLLNRCEKRRRRAGAARCSDLFHTLQDLQAWGVSVVAQTGLQFDLRSAQGKLIASLMAALAEFERDLLREWVRSGIAAARKRGVVFGRRPGQRVKSDRLALKC